MNNEQIQNLMNTYRLSQSEAQIAIALQNESREGGEGGNKLSVFEQWLRIMQAE